MDGFDGLIKIHRQELDEKRRTLAEIQGQQDQLVAQQHMIDRQVAEEMARAQHNPDARDALPLFVQGAKWRKAELQKQIDALEPKVQAARDEVSDCFQDVKKYEIAQETIQRKRKEQLARYEQNKLDEISMNLHRQRQEREKEQDAFEEHQMEMINQAKNRR